MTAPEGSWDPPQDTGAPDAAETDAAALSGAEDLDEDRLRADPLEAGMDPPENWSGATRYGMTPWEQSHDRPLEDRLAEEEPDVEPVSAPDPDGPAESAAVLTDTDVRTAAAYDRELGISADGPDGRAAP